jgi:hypothetical protein
MRNALLLLLLAVSLSSAAQDSKDAHFFPEFSHAIGGSYQKFNGLNSRVAGLPQYKQLPTYAATLELGWFKERNNLISNAGLTAGSSMSGDRDKRSSTIRFVGVHAEVGYNVLQSKMLMLYPLAGLGVEMYQALFYKDNSAVDFNDVLASSTVENNIRSVAFKNTFFNYRLGLGFAVKSPKHPSNSIGIQAGYTGSFTDRAWKSNEGQSLSNAPTDKLSRVYAGLIVIMRPRFRR